MADTRSPEQRRRIMQSVGVAHTGPEMTVRRMLHKKGYRYRLHVKTLPGRPDLVFWSRRIAIFVHGCFWHSHGCAKGRPPKSRLDYWLPKLDANRTRDKRNIDALNALGWTVLVLWQCQTRDSGLLEQLLTTFLDGGRKSDRLSSDDTVASGRAETT